MNSFAATAAPHLPVLIGLLLGTLGKYGLALDEGEPIELRKVLGHLMMLGVLGLVAETGADWVNLSAYSRALAGAGVALAAGKAVRRFRKWAERETEERFPLRRTPDRETDPSAEAGPSTPRKDQA